MTSIDIGRAALRSAAVRLYDLYDRIGVRLKRMMPERAMAAIEAVMAALSWVARGAETVLAGSFLAVSVGIAMFLTCGTGRSGSSIVIRIWGAGTGTAGLSSAFAEEIIADTAGGTPAGVRYEGLS